MHAVLQNDNLYISPDLDEVFLFLSNIENEIYAQLHIKNKLKEISQKFGTILEDMELMTDLLIKNNINYEFKSTKNTLTIVDDFETNHNIRVIMIAIFAFLETIFCIVTVFEKQIIDEKKIIHQTKNSWEQLFKKYLLTDDNEFYVRNKERLSQISVDMIKSLRNTLTHFFSVSSRLILLENGGEKKRDEIESLLKKNGTIGFGFTPEEWFTWIGCAVFILLNERTEMSLLDKGLFSSKMSAVKQVVEKYASKIRNTMNVEKVYV